MPLGFAIPMHRLASLLGVVSDSQVHSILSQVADIFLSIYIYSGISISEAVSVQGDDSPTLVLEYRKKAQDGRFEVKKHPMVEELTKEFGLFFPFKQKNGYKKKVNISVLHAEFENQGPTIFYRTHFGSFGNLLSKILENRSPKKKGLLIQGDSSPENNIDPLLKHLLCIQAGCGSHARRPFWRHKNDDENLCGFMLHAFGLLAKVEHLIDSKGGSPEITLKFRKKYSEKIWEIIKRKCESVLNTKKIIPALGHFVWPKNSHFGQACFYIVKNYSQLTTYLKHPELEWTNNFSERILRGEKLLLNSSKFRRSELGRVRIDIVRTLVMTCRINNVPVDKYLEFIYRNKDFLKENPQSYTPQAYSLIQMKTQQKVHTAC